MILWPLPTLTDSMIDSTSHHAPKCGSGSPSSTQVPCPTPSVEQSLVHSSSSPYRVAYRWEVSGRCCSRRQLVEEDRKKEKKEEGRKERSVRVCQEQTGQRSCRRCYSHAMFPSHNSLWVHASHRSAALSQGQAVSGMGSRTGPGAALGQQ